MKIPYNNSTMFGYCSNVLSTGTVNNLRNWATVSPSHAVQASLFVFPYLKKRKSIFQARGYKKYVFNLKLYIRYFTRIP